MPNHVTCRLEINGPADAIQRLRKQITVKDGDGKRLALEQLVPRPEIYDRTESGSRSIAGFRVVQRALADCGPDTSLYFSKRPHVAEGDRIDCDDTIAKTLAGVEALLRHGYSDWYDWSIANWGTKWGTYSVEEMESGDDCSLGLSFCTAWSPPMPLLEALNDRYPELSWEFDCFDEGWNFGGSANNHEGFVDDQIGEATDETYEKVFGFPPEREDEEEHA